MIPPAMAMPCIWDRKPLTVADFPAYLTKVSDRFSAKSWEWDGTQSYHSGGPRGEAGLETDEGAAGVGDSWLRAFGRCRVEVRPSAGRVVADTLARPNRAGEEAIAAIVGVRPADIWPSRYDATASA